MKKLLLLALLLVASHASAANHYVRAGAGGTADGSDWTNACTDFTGSCAVASLVRGDTYFVADGTYAAQRKFDRANSGTLVITIQKATIASHGTATGWLDSYGDGQAIFPGYIMFVSDYWVFDGVSRTSLFAGHGFKIDKQAAPDSEGAIIVGDPGSGPSGVPADHIVLKYIEVNGSHDRTETYHDTGLRAVSTDQSDLLFSYSYIHDATIPVKLTQASSYTFEYNAFTRNFSSAAWHTEGIAVGCSDAITVRYNHFEDIEGTAHIAAAGCNARASSNWLFYGNIFLRSSGNPGGIGDVGAGIFDFISNTVNGSTFIYNNSIVHIKNTGGDGGGPSRMFNANADASIADLRIRNNLWYDSTQMDDSSTTCLLCTSFTWSHNAYFDTTSVSDSDADKQTGTGSPFVDWANKNFHLAANTIAGTALGSPYNFDPDGVVRSTWSRGAFEYIPAGGGGAPGTAYAPISLTFAETPVGHGTVTQTITLTNAGDAVLTITTIAASGTNAADFHVTTNCPLTPSTVAASGTCTITIYFNPGAAGSRSGSVTVTSDAASGPDVLTLSGTAVTKSSIALIGIPQ